MTAFANPNTTGNPEDGVPPTEEPTDPLIALADAVLLPNREAWIRIPRPNNPELVRDRLQEWADEKGFHIKIGPPREAAAIVQMSRLLQVRANEEVISALRDKSEGPQFLMRATDTTNK